jgi:hypothetical protein
MKVDSREKNARHVVSLVVTVATLAATFAAHALDPPYLAEMPGVETVLADNEGKDRLDTLARQQAALNQLVRAIGFLAGDREFCCLTQDEEVLRGKDDPLKSAGFVFARMQIHGAQDCYNALYA